MKLKYLSVVAASAAGGSHSPAQAKIRATRSPTATSACSRPMRSRAAMRRPRPIARSRPRAASSSMSTASRSGASPPTCPSRAWRMQARQRQHRLLRAGPDRHHRPDPRRCAPGRRRRRPAGAGNPVGHRPRQWRRCGHVRHGLGDRHGHRHHPSRPQRRHRAQPQLPWRQHHAGRPEWPWHARRGHHRGARQHHRRDRRCAGRTGGRGSRARSSRQRLQLGRHRRGRLCRRRTVVRATSPT